MRQPSWPIALTLSLVLSACGAPAQPAGPAAVPAASAGATVGGAPPAADPAAPRPGLTSAGESSEACPTSSKSPAWNRNLEIHEFSYYFLAAANKAGQCRKFPLVNGKQLIVVGFYFAL